MFIFPLIYIVSFVVAFREVLKGNREGVFIFLIFGLSVYTTSMSVAFMLGLKDFITAFQSFKEVLIISVLILNIVTLKQRPRLGKIDYAILAFFLYTVIYALIPLGTLSFTERLGALKALSFFVIVYFAGRLMDLKDIYISKYFNYIVLLTIAAGVVLLFEVIFYTHLQTLTGYADYNYYFFNFEPAGSFGLTTTFESDSGLKRFAAFFSTPIEHGAAALLALCIIASLYTTDDNKIKINTLGITALCASFLSIIFAFSRAPLISYFVIIYIYALVTKRKIITKTIHLCFGLAALYLAYQFAQFESTSNGIVQVIMNTVDFSDPSSLGHLIEWVEGSLAIIAHPLGLGIGSSGRIAGSLGENVGGENQFIIIGVQVGVVALFLYLYIYIAFINKSLKWLRVLKGKERKVCMAILLLKVGLLIPLFTTELESSAYISYLSWFLSGLFVSIIMQPQPTLIPIIAIDDH